MFEELRSNSATLPPTSVGVMGIHFITVLLQLQAFSIGYVSGEGTIFVHLHTFLLPTGCRPARLDLPYSGQASRVCEVYFRVCLQTVPLPQQANFVCPPSSYTTQRFHHNSPDQHLSLSSSQPAHIPFIGAAENHTVLIEFWGQELDRVSSSPLLLGAFELEMASSTGDWSENLRLTQSYPAALSLQWKVTCSYGYFPHGSCFRPCLPKGCILCHPNGIPYCQDGCSSEKCPTNRTTGTWEWTPWSLWTRCNQQQKQQKRTRTCQISRKIPEGTGLAQPTALLTCAGQSREVKSCHFTLCNSSDHLTFEATVAAMCNINPCKHGGTCIYWQSSSKVDGRCEGNYRCQCPQFYNGEHCEKQTPSKLRMKEDASLGASILMLFGVTMTALVFIGLICFCRQKYFQRKPAKPKKRKPHTWNVKKKIEIVHPHLAGRDIEHSNLQATSQSERVDNDYGAQDNSTVIANLGTVIEDIQLKEIDHVIPSPPPLPPDMINCASNNEVFLHKPPSSPAPPHHHYNDLDAELGNQTVFTPPESDRPQWMLAKSNTTTNCNTDTLLPHAIVRPSTPKNITTKQDPPLVIDNQGYELPAESTSKRSPSHQIKSSSTSEASSAQSKHLAALEQLFSSKTSQLVDKSLFTSSHSRQALNPLYRHNPETAADNLSATTNM